MTKPYCQYSLDQIRQSGLFSQKRLAAIEAEVAARTQPCFDRDGKEITTAKMADLGEGGRYLYLRYDGNHHQEEYMQKDILAVALTSDELKLVNDRCTEGWRQQVEAKRFEAATKLDQWDGWVTDGDRYWDCVEAYLDERGDEILDAGEGEIVPYLWAAKPRQVIPSLDVSDVADHYIDNVGWEDMEISDLKGLPELQAALDAFVKANGNIVSYWPDYTKAIMLTNYLKPTT